MKQDADKILEVKNLQTHFFTDEGTSNQSMESVSPSIKRKRMESSRGREAGKALHRSHC